MNAFIGASTSALQKIANVINKQTIIFGNEEIERLAENMPKKIIPGAVDENFILDDMTLILQDPI